MGTGGRCVRIRGASQPLYAMYATSKVRLVGRSLAPSPALGLIPSTNAPFPLPPFPTPPTLPADLVGGLTLARSTMDPSLASVLLIIVVASGKVVGALAVAAV